MKVRFQIRILKSLLRRLYKPLLDRYLRKDRVFRYQNLRTNVFPGVFHPGFFFSTKILLAFLEKCDLKNKSFLELGAGSGLISVVAAKRGAIVTASDISKKAMENSSMNAQLNNVSIKQIHSDLFENIPHRQFDFIVINPPYYKGKITKESDHAWYAGEQLEYFQKLFHQLPPYMNRDTKALMILSDECDIHQIQTMAASNNFVLTLVYSGKVWWETNFIFEINFN